MRVFRRLSLIKGKDRFVFDYTSGQEIETLGAIMSLADDPESEFDWFDAFVISCQMGRHLEHELDNLRLSQSKNPE